MAYNPNHHYNRRDQNPGPSNQSYVPNSNVQGKAVENFHATNQQYSSNPPNAHTGRPSEYANNSFDQQHASYRPNMSNLNDASQYRSDNRGNTNASGVYNPSLQNPKFSSHQQNSGDSLHSLKQTLAHTLQNLSNSGVGGGYSQPEHAYRSVQSQPGGPASLSYHEPQSHSQAQYGYEPPTETVFSRSMQPPASLPNSHHLAINRYPQNTPLDTRISAAVAPVPGDVRYQAAQQSHSAQHSNVAPSFNSTVPNRASGLDRNNNTFTPTAVPRVAQGFVQPQVGANAYYNRRPESAGVNTPAYQPDNREAFSPRDSNMAGGVHMYDMRSKHSADPYVHGASVGGPRRDDIAYSRVAHRDTSPHSSFRHSHSVDRNTTQYNNNPPHSTHYTPQVASHSQAVANPLPSLPSRTSKWSARLVDPLDIYDKLLHNSLCIYEERGSSAHVTTQPNVVQRADNREDRLISTSIPTTSRYNNNNTLSPTPTSRKRAISPTNSIASDHNYYSSGDNRYPTHSGDRSIRPRVADYSDIRKNDSRDSRDRSNRFSDRDHSRNRRSRSPSRSRTVATKNDKHSSSHPFRSVERLENRSLVNRGVTEQKHGLVNISASITTTTNSIQSTKNKPDYALTTPSQLCAIYRTPSVSLHYIQYPTILRVQDLCTKYPRLYVPNAFLRVTLDTHSMLQALDSNFITKIVEPVPLLVESANPLLCNIPSITDTGVYESPLFSTLPATSMNNTLVVSSKQDRLSYNGVLSADNSTTTVNRSTATNLSTKFQVRVLVCCGVQDINTIDPHKPLEEQLRILCGERKSGVTLLGCPWEDNLDKCDDSSSTDTPLTNRSCLVKTAQRALFAQSLLRIPVEVLEDPSTDTKHYSSPGLVSLCEINYLRPAEVVNGVESEEQMEVTTIFLYSLQPHLLQPDFLSKNAAELFSARVSGTSAGPSINDSVEMFDKKAVDSAMASDANSVDLLVPDQTTSEGVEGDVTHESEAMQSQPSVEVTVSNTDVTTTTADVVSADSAIAIATSTAAAADSVDTLLASFVERNTTTDATNDLASAPLTCAELSVDTSITTTAATDYTDKEKHLPPVIPSEPTLLLCPMPYTSEVLLDKKKSRDLVSLKLGTLSDMAVGYSQSDRTERVFELALAAELTLSLLATNFANTLTDFVLAGHPLLSRDVDTGLVSAYAALCSANLKPKKSHTHTSNIRNSSSAAACEKTSDRLTDPSDVSMVVADLLNSIVDSVDSNTAPATTPGDVTERSKDIDSAEECSFAIDKTPSKEEVVLKIEPVENEPMVEEEVPVENSAVASVEPGATECDLELRSRFLTAARWFDVHDEKCLHLEHLKIILHSSTRVLSVGAVKEAVKRVCENDKFDYETCV